MSVSCIRPSAINNIPPTRFIYFISIFFLLSFSRIDTPNKAVIKNGSPKPIEKIINKTAPCTTVADVEARSRIEPKTGPIHGDQPKPIENPTMNELPTVPGFNIFGGEILNDLCRDCILITSINNNPKIIMITPPTRVKTIRN